jgi:deoxynucleoside triphosphate triphosphohydrolase SAMHD1
MMLDNNIIQKMLIFDNVHGYIEISDLAKKIIDTPEFQRLRNIHQTGALYLVFPTAVHTRFEHSIGTYHLTGVILNKIQQKQPELNLTNKLIELIKIGGLCHDLGHCTFSHTFDDVVLKKLPFYNDLGDEKHHEYRSIMLVKHIVNKYGIEISDKEIVVIQDVIFPKKNRYDEWNTEYKVGKFILDIVCNERNSIDVDKFDYISRDNLAIGLKLGFDYTRLLDQARVIDDIICYPKKIIEDIFHLFFVRYRLYKQIYNHKAVVAIEYMYGDILLDFFLKTEFLKKEDLKNPDKLIQLTDQIFYFIEINGYSEELFKRIKSRDLYKLKIQYNLPLDSNEKDQLEDILKDKDNVIKQNLKIGYVSGNSSNPLDNIYFYNSYDKNNKYKVDKSNISLLISNENYQEKSIRIYIKNNS